MTGNIIGNVCLYDMIMYFFIFGFLGWVVEVIFATLKTGKFVNRGFLNGPICPIYGIGMAVCILLLNTLTDKWWLLFIVGSVFASILEFITGFILDKIFKTKWWDYSNEPFNVKGYVCLRFSLLWGMTILLTFYTVVPLADKIISLIPFKYLGIIIIVILFLILITDITTDVLQLKKLFANLNVINEITGRLHKNSDKIGGKISDSVIITAEKLSKLRLVKAFPHLRKKTEEFMELVKKEK